VARDGDKPASQPEVPSSETAATDPRANRALAVVSAAVFLASSTWFTGTAVTPFLTDAWDLSGAAAAWLTIGTQLGFIAGTFLYSILNLSDIFNARRVFFASAALGALFNLGFAWLAEGLATAVVFRILTGLTLAGVYPVGMKIIATWFEGGLGYRLGIMVGALTLGTAAPYLLETVAAGLPWHVPVATASGLALAGGTLILVAVEDGPYLRETAEFDASMMFRVFREPKFRLTAFGYFGHMWELYAFWSLVGVYLAASFESGTNWAEVTGLVAFFAVAIGAVGCAVGGWISRQFGMRRVAAVSLAVSATFCATSGFAFSLPAPILVVFVLVWGLFVVSDSPQFSALAAEYAPDDYTGTALTIQNGVGFALTVVSIQLTPAAAAAVSWRWAFLILIPGPLLGLWAMIRLGRLERGERT